GAARQSPGASVRVSDGIRTRDRRDHNPRDRVPSGAFLALERASNAVEFPPVPLRIVHEPRFRLASRRGGAKAAFTRAGSSPAGGGRRGFSYSLNPTTPASNRRLPLVVRGDSASTASDSR